MNKRGKFFTGIGLLLLTAAFFLTVYNIRNNAKAGSSADTVLEQIMSEFDNNDYGQPAISSDDSSKQTDIPDYILNPGMQMPMKKINGNEYIGVLRIPALSLELPIISEWSYSNLKIAPCRYDGSVYLDNMVIAAHNYNSHFGYLKNLSQGDNVIFIDMDENVFNYEIIEIETLSPSSVDEMKNGDCDLTLFTCTIGGGARITVRCVRTDT